MSAALGFVEGISAQTALQLSYYFIKLIVCEIRWLCHHVLGRGGIKSWMGSFFFKKKLYYVSASPCLFSTVFTMQRDTTFRTSFNFHITVFWVCCFLFVSKQVPPQIGPAPLMAPQSVIYTQPGLRPTNPFAPISGTQVNCSF